MYKVTYREVGTTENVVEVMDSKMLGAFYIDWAYEIIDVEEVETVKKRRFFFF